MGQEHCILIHGFTGDPTELAPLAEALRSSGYHVTSPRLTGHDGTFLGLSGISASEWVESAARPVQDALRTGPVHLVGFSMGALIAAILATREPVSSLTMLAPAFHYARPDLLLRQAGVFVKSRLQPASEEAQYIRRRPSGFLITPPSSLRQFRATVRQAKRVLPNVTVPTCIIQGDRDEIVHPKSSNYVYESVQSLNREIVHLPRSHHHVCLDVESDIVIERVTTFLASPPVRRHVNG